MWHSWTVHKEDEVEGAHEESYEEISACAAQ